MNLQEVAGKWECWQHVRFGFRCFREIALTLRLLMSYIYGAPSKARNANVVYIWTYVWQR